MISDSPEYLLLVFDISERFSIEAILWEVMVIGRKLRKLRELKMQFDNGWLLAGMPGLRYSPVLKIICVICGQSIAFTLGTDSI